MTVTPRLIGPAVAIVLLLATTPARAQVSITLFAGYSGSTGVENVTTDADADVRSAASYGITLGTTFDASRELQLQYAQQSTTLVPGGGST
jgi:hypothetical protein